MLGGLGSRIPILRVAKIAAAAVEEPEIASTCPVCQVFVQVFCHFGAADASGTSST